MGQTSTGLWGTHNPLMKSDYTLLSLADPSDITSIHDTATAAHRFSSTLDLGLLSALQKKRVTTIVIITARREMEQPTIEMISRAFLSASPIWESK